MKKAYLFIISLLLISKISFSQYVTSTPTIVANAPTTGTGWIIPSSSDPYVFFSIINHSKDLYSFGYVLPVPLTATVTGIEVNYKYTAVFSGSASVYDTIARMVKNNVLVGDNKASSTPDYTVVSSPTNVKMGGSTDLWGTTWVPSDFYNPNFGFDLKVKSIQTSANFQIVNGFSITVFYTTVTGLEESQTSSPLVYSYNNHIYFPSVNPNEIAVIEVFDMLGNKVFEKTITESTTQVSLGDLTTGLYIYKYRSGQKEFNRKMYVN